MRSTGISVRASAHTSPSLVSTSAMPLAARGLDGVEVRHPGHTPADTQRLGRLAGELDLVPSGGSDWHGATEGYRTLGNMHVPEAWLDLQDVRLVTRVS